MKRLSRFQKHENGESPDEGKEQPEPVSSDGFHDFNLLIKPVPEFEQICKSIRIKDTVDFHSGVEAIQSRPCAQRKLMPFRPSDKRSGIIQRLVNSGHNKHDPVVALIEGKARIERAAE